MFPAPKTAIEPSHVVITPVSEQDHYWLNEKYPASTALEHYKRVFASWRPCYGRERGWESFGDRTTDQPTYVHQLLRHWVNPANDTSVTLGLRYISSGSNYRITPDTDRQFVVLVRVKQPNASQTLVEMGVTCEKDS
jgi:hypothetical protein